MSSCWSLMTKKYINEHKCMAPENILSTYAVKRSVCARTWTLFTAVLPVIQSLRQTVRSDVRFTKSFFWLWITGLNVVNHFLHRPIVSLHKISIQRGLILSSLICFYILKTCSRWLAFYKSPRPMVLAQTLLYCLTDERKSPTSWMTWVWVN